MADAVPMSADRAALLRIFCPRASFRLPLSQPYSGPAAILVEEFDACCFKRSTYCPLIRDRHACLNVAELSSADCAKTYGLVLARSSALHPQNCPRSSDLKASHAPSPHDRLCVFFSAIRHLRTERGSFDSPFAGQCEVQEAADCFRAGRTIILLLRPFINVISQADGEAHSSIGSWPVGGRPRFFRKTLIDFLQYSFLHKS